MLNGNILITGGSGFLGRAILRKAEKEKWPASFTVYSRDETKQWELKHRYPNVRCALGDVSRDLDRLIALMQGHDIVIHAAAVKYIPEAEWNVFETIDVNIEGSRNVTIAARAAGVKTVVGISTDKACGPLNVYGMTKGVMERMFSEANRMGSTNFVTVRYGNVVGSTGSVIPVFKKQIEEKKQIMVTDSRMTRFWLGVDEAIELIEWAATEAPNYQGHTFITACPAMKIVDLAKTIWNMEGCPEGEIVFSGIRPGEKLHEALFNEQEAPRVIDAGRNKFIMKPATMSGAIPDTMGYSSDHPSRWLTPADMATLIADAKSV